MRTDRKGTNRRQKVLMTAMAVTAIVAIVTVVVGPWRGGTGVSEEGAVRNPGLQVPRPPEVDTSRPYVAVSPEIVPGTGGEVALILGNPSAQPIDFGPLGRLQRWDGTTWSDHRQFTTSLGPEQPAGALHGLDEEIMVPAIALTAQPGDFAAPVWTRISGLNAGWYRFQLGNATGVLQVGGTDQTAASRPTTALAFSGADAVHAGSASTLNLDPQPRKPTNGEFNLDQQLGKYTSDARIERWDEGRWVVVPSDTTRTIAGQPANGAFAVDLPAMDAGVYRVSRETSVAGRVESLFWVLPLG